MQKVFHRVAAVADVPTGQGIPISLPDGNDCVVYRDDTGTVFATGSLCPHQNEPLDTGHLEGREVICRRHHLRFDLKSGDCTNASGYGLKVYDVEVRGDDVWIGLWDWD